MAKKPKLPTAGAESGVGRLQKAKLAKRNKRMALEGEKGAQRSDRKPRT